MFNKLPLMCDLLKWVLNFEACLSAYPYYYFVKFCYWHVHSYFLCVFYITQVIIRSVRVEHLVGSGRGG